MHCRKHSVDISTLQYTDPKGNLLSGIPHILFYNHGLNNLQTICLVLKSEFLRENVNLLGKIISDQETLGACFCCRLT